MDSGNNTPTSFIMRQFHQLQRRESRRKMVEMPMRRAEYGVRNTVFVIIIAVMCLGDSLRRGAGLQSYSHRSEPGSVGDQLAQFRSWSNRNYAALEDSKSSTTALHRVLTSIPAPSTFCLLGDGTAERSIPAICCSIVLPGRTMPLHIIIIIINVHSDHRYVARCLICIWRLFPIRPLWPCLV